MTQTGIRAQQRETSWKRAEWEALVEAEFQRRIPGSERAYFDVVVDTGEWCTFAWGQATLSIPGQRIEGGTDEILRNILADRVLGLPKSAGWVVSPRRPAKSDSL